MTAGFCLLARGRFADAYDRLTSSVTGLENIDQASLLRALNGAQLCAWAIGEFDLAIQICTRAHFYAERAGDYPTASKIASNLSAIYVELGLLTEAESKLEKSIEFEKRAPNHRYSSLVYNNGASLYITTHELKRASQMLELGAVAARRAKLPVLLADNLFYQADYHLAERFPEEALRNIEAADSILSLSTSRSTMTYQTNAVRLHEYRAWHLGSEPREAAELDSNSDLPLVGFVELAAFREWVSEQDGRLSASRPNAEDLIKATGLNGIKQKLRQLGLYPSGSSDDAR